MKPVGLKDPRTGRMPYAVVQLRQENLRADSYNLVGFQNHLKFGEQARVLRMIPGLENARFLRYGQIHRNTYINGPELLRETLQMKAHPRVLFAGQICGVEGYVESIATGLMAGQHAAALALGTELVPPPRASAFGSLTHYVTHADAKNFQPANITFDLLPALEKKIRDRKERHRLQVGPEAVRRVAGAHRSNGGEGLTRKRPARIYLTRHSVCSTFLHIRPTPRCALDILRCGRHLSRR
jgi:methylenetetrahydrofolate--tRNA-(uracil-5-)-methyltransferase